MGCFHLLAFVNNVTMNTDTQMSLQDPTFISFAYLPRYGVAGSYGNSTLNSLRTHHTIFYNSCAILDSHQQWESYQHFFLSILFYIIGILRNLGWFFAVILICIFLMNSDVEHRFTCLLTNCVSALEKDYSGPLPII